MTAEEYIVERLQKLEKNIEDLKGLIDDQTNTINYLKEQLSAHTDLLTKAKLELQFNAEYDSYALNFRGYYSSINDSGKDCIKEIINDLKIINSLPHAKIIVDCEKMMKERGDLK